MIYGWSGLPKAIYNAQVPTLQKGRRWYLNCLGGLVYGSVLGTCLNSDIKHRIESVNLRNCKRNPNFCGWLAHTTKHNEGRLPNAPRAAPISHRPSTCRPSVRGVDRPSLAELLQFAHGLTGSPVRRSHSARIVGDRISGPHEERRTTGEAGSVRYPN